MPIVRYSFKHASTAYRDNMGRIINHQKGYLSRQISACVAQLHSRGQPSQFIIFSTTILTASSTYC